MDIRESEADWRYATVGRVKGDQTVFERLAKDRALVWLTSVVDDAKVGQVSFRRQVRRLWRSASLSIARERLLPFASKCISAAADVKRERSRPKAFLRCSRTSNSLWRLLFSHISVWKLTPTNQSLVVSEPMDVSRRRGVERLEPHELERNLSTDEKLTSVLPKAMSVPSPKATRVWAPYRDLKEVRDSTVHLKSADHYVRGKADRESVYYRLLQRSPLKFPRTALKVILHFCGATPERWLELAEARLKTLTRE